MSDIDREAEPFRWCVYCDADCEVEEPEHAATCPSSTGVFPVREQDVLCRGCKQTYLGMRCSECDAEFQVGDHYTHRRIGEASSLASDDECPVYDLVCLGCAAREAFA